MWVAFAGSSMVTGVGFAVGLSFDPVQAARSRTAAAAVVAARRLRGIWSAYGRARVSPAFKMRHLGARS